MSPAALGLTEDAWRLPCFGRLRPTGRPSSKPTRPRILQAGRATGVAFANERIAADRVIVTAGAWVNTVLRLAGPGLAIEPQRGQIVHMHLNSVETQDWPVILPPGSHYIVPFDHGRIVAGATRETGSGFDYRVTAAGQAEVLQEALRIAPGLEAATILETRVGFRQPARLGRCLDGWKALTAWRSAMASARRG